ncbi:TetR/AcrR family transcriptional regulator [Nitratireductor mangrovi]|uniref:TetR/AcrR family transcriptional regulator n=1 Tax=Nitratireductor mangrovi TaxID=2599600 RepID=A0A5B8KWA2_9HYPH|nr:TetR/AcrR family transcriptional regulator [Nitratireductor mangrovi]QDY99943.2 TetR/AcrR family transcriptional regulator [Nitratireductor mangrovi]
MSDATAREQAYRPRQTRALQTRAALIAAAERLIAEFGEETVTTSRVAAECGVAVGSVYRYFPDRDALLLAAYDETVARVVQACSQALEGLEQGLAAQVAARKLLRVYLDAAEAIPAHARLLRAMRRIRPVEHDQGEAEDRIAGDILAPFLERFAPGAGRVDRASLTFLNVLLGTLVDLYLVEERTAVRARLRDDIEAHMLLALGRIIGGDAPSAG